MVNITYLIIGILIMVVGFIGIKFKNFFGKYGWGGLFGLPTGNEMLTGKFDKQWRFDMRRKRAILYGYIFIIIGIALIIASLIF